jgi:hypothetical protein
MEYCIFVSNNNIRDLFDDIRSVAPSSISINVFDSVIMETEVVYAFSAFKNRKAPEDICGGSQMKH